MVMDAPLPLISSARAPWTREHPSWDTPAIRVPLEAIAAIAAVDLQGCPHALAGSVEMAISPNAARLRREPRSPVRRSFGPARPVTRSLTGA